MTAGFQIHIPNATFWRSAEMIHPDPKEHAALVARGDHLTLAWVGRYPGGRAAIERYVDEILQAEPGCSGVQVSYQGGPVVYGKRREAVLIGSSPIC